MSVWTSIGCSLCVDVITYDIISAFGFTRNLILRSESFFPIDPITEYHGSIAGGRVPSSSTGLATKMDTALFFN